MTMPLAGAMAAGKVETTDTGLSAVEVEEPLGPAAAPLASVEIGTGVVVAVRISVGRTRVWLLVLVLVLVTDGIVVAGPESTLDTTGTAVETEVVETTGIEVGMGATDVAEEIRVEASLV